MRHVTKPSISNLQSGQTVQAGYKRRELLVDENFFPS